MHRKFQASYGFLVIILSFFTIISLSQGQSTGSKSNPEGSEEQSGDVDSKQTENKKIEFSTYKDSYDKEDIRFDRDDLVEACNGNPGALVEFVFIQKQDDGYKTFPTDYYWMVQEKKTAGQNQFKMLYVGDEKKIGDRVVVGENCGDDATRPGKKYILKGFNERKRYQYPVQIPEKEKLTYKSKYDPNMVYRYPILVNEVFATKEKNEEERDADEKQAKKKFELTIKGVSPLKNKNNWIHIQYINGGVRGIMDRSGEPDQNGYWTMKVRASSRSEALGGSIGVYKATGKERRGDNRKGKKLQTLKLMKYKKNISSMTVDLSQHPEFEKKEKNWVRRTYKLDRELLRKKFDVEEVSREEIDRATVQLTLQDSNRNLYENRFNSLLRGNDISVFYSRKLSLKNGHVMVDLKAPEGTYDLFFNSFLLKKDIKWPPK